MKVRYRHKAPPPPFRSSLFLVSCHFLAALRLPSFPLFAQLCDESWAIRELLVRLLGLGCFGSRLEPCFVRALRALCANPAGHEFRSHHIAVTVFRIVRRNVQKKKPDLQVALLRLPARRAPGAHHPLCG